MTKADPRPASRARRARVLVVLVAIAVGVGVPVSRPADAVVPGASGRIVFEFRRDGNSEIHSVAADGKDLRNLTRHPAGDLDPVWSPDGTRIAFVSNREGSAEVYLMDTDGGAVTRLTDGGGSQPTWSPDGKRIAFTRSDSIYVTDIDAGSIPVRLTRPQSDPDPARQTVIGDSVPTWSPDGSRIAFVRMFRGEYFRDRTRRVYVIDTDGTGDLAVLADELKLNAVTDMDWSPTGEFVAIGTVEFYTQTAAISIVTDDGAPVAALGRFGDPAFSPDGTSMAVTVNRPNRSIGLHVVSPDLSDAPDLTTTPPPTFLVNGSDGEAFSHPSWQPVNPHPIGLVDPEAGRWYLRAEAGDLRSFYYGNPGDVPFLGDWDCDGIETPGLFRPSDAYAYLRNSNTAGVADIRFYFGNPGDVPLAGDFDGDGCDTLSLYRPSEQRFYVINRLGENEGGLGAAEHSFTFGDPGDRAVVGDWDGDGIDEVGLHRESTGYFYYRNTLDTGIASGGFSFGDPGDRCVAGDWGIVDGVDTPGCFRPANTTFYFRHTMTQGRADSQFTWGEEAWLPVSGVPTDVQL